MTTLTDPAPYGYIAIGLAFATAYGFAHWAYARKLIGLPDASRRIGCIDGLRGYLALGVVMHHFSVWLGVLAGRPWAAPQSNVLNNLGQAAVVVFFMVTGALFYSRILPGPGKQSIDWFKLYLSRIFRLVPLYWCAVAVVAAIAIARRGGVVGDLGALGIALRDWAFFLGQPNIAGYSPTGQIIAYTPWTLRYEWLFYASLPVLAFALKQVTSRGGASLIIPLGVIALAFADRELFAGAYLKFALAFAYGMLAIELAQRPGFADWLKSPAAALLGLAALVTEMTVFHDCLTDWLPIGLLAVFFAPVVSGNSYFGLLSRPASIVLGELSYSIYLLHGIVLSLFMVEGVKALSLPVTPALWMVLPVLAVVVVAIALLTFSGIERPAIALGERLANKRGTPAERQSLTTHP